jgi:hypothetical protein
MTQQSEDIVQIFSHVFRAFVALLTLTPVLSAAAPAAKSEPEPGVVPAAPDLEDEWKRQFEDLKIQLADNPTVLKAIASRHRNLEEQVYRRESLLLPTDRDPVDVVLRRTQAVLGQLKLLPGVRDLSPEESQLKDLADAAVRTSPDAGESRYELFARLCRLRRKIVLANPVLDFRDIVFVKRGELVYNHMCPQYFGCMNEGGGGLFCLEGAFSDAPRLRNLLAEAKVERGRLKGEKLGRWAFLSPALSYDARAVLFACAEKRPQQKGRVVPQESLMPLPGLSPEEVRQICGGRWNTETSCHIFKINIDGTGLEQLTDGPWDEFDPCFLPNGRIVFLSMRRGGFGRCHGDPLPTYTLHSMNPDGSDIVRLSHHETDEWNPSVTNEGMIVYTRWDYVDRGNGVAQHPWVTRPDGTDARAIHGNYPSGQPSARPSVEAHVRAIPGSHKFTATAHGHHGEALGSLVLLDPNVKDDGAMSQLKRITPEMLFPEWELAPELHRHWPGATFGTAWPLSEDFYLAVYQPRRAPQPPDPKQRPRRNSAVHGIYLVDSFGNRELVYRDPELRCWNPIPLKPRPLPPVLPHGTLVGLPPGAASSDSPPVAGGGDKTGASGEGTVALMNVYHSLLPWPKGTKITALRVVQILPKATPSKNTTVIGFSNEIVARGVLGTVPVEEDGSAHFILPAGKPVYFQALDERGLAVQSMMSAAYVHPGERLTCQGCHEPRYHAPKTIGMPLAIARAPSRLQPEVDGAMPLAFPRLVQPVLDRNCVGCHQKEAKAPSLAGKVSGDRRNGQHLVWTEAYLTLSRFAWAAGGSRSTPGQVGARASRLLPMLEKGHHDVKLSPEDFHRLTLWLDGSSPFFGAYTRLEEQARGVLVPPELE